MLDLTLLFGLSRLWNLTLSELFSRCSSSSVVTPLATTHSHSHTYYIYNPRSHSHSHSHSHALTLLSAPRFHSFDSYRTPIASCLRSRKPSCMHLNLQIPIREEFTPPESPQTFSPLAWFPLAPAPPIMAGVTPSPEVSPASAATTNGQFPRDSFCLNLSSLPDASSFVLKSSLRSPHLFDSPNGLSSLPPTSSYHAVKKRPRNMSQSSGTDREMSHPLDAPQAANGASNGGPTSNSANNTNSSITNSNSNNSPDPRPNPKKRPSTDAIDYPRRRATIAVCALNSLFSTPDALISC